MAVPKCCEMRLGTRRECLAWESAERVAGYTLTVAPRVRRVSLLCHHSRLGHIAAMDDDYYSVDSILAENQKIQCTFKVDIPDMGHLDGGNERDVSCNTTDLLRRAERYLDQDP